MVRRRYQLQIKGKTMTSPNDSSRMVRPSIQKRKYEPHVARARPISFAARFVLTQPFSDTYTVQNDVQTHLVIQYRPAPFAPSLSVVDLPCYTLQCLPFFFRQLTRYRLALPPSTHGHAPRTSPTRCLSLPLSPPATNMLWPVPRPLRVEV